MFHVQLAAGFSEWEICRDNLDLIAVAKLFGKHLEQPLEMPKCKVLLNDNAFSLVEVCTVCSIDNIWSKTSANSKVSSRDFEVRRSKLACRASRGLGAQQK